jgi:hypothetical protein
MSAARDRRRDYPTKVGIFTQALYNAALKQRWVVISMKNDWEAHFRV